MAEILGWAFVGYVTLNYLRSDSTPLLQPAVPQPKNRDDDARRYKHTGEQPTFHKEGNRSMHKDHAVYELAQSIDMDPASFKDDYDP